MTSLERQPPGPDKPYNANDDLLDWMRDQFSRFGDIYKASVYGTNVFVTRDPTLADHVLRGNWRNYVKGQAIKRVALLLGNGLMVSEGEFWKHQRRMVQPALHGACLTNLVEIVRTLNSDLVNSWEAAAQEAKPVNVTVSISQMVLKVVVISIFGDDYEYIGSSFNILSENSARSLEFAKIFRSLRREVLGVIDRRRKQEATAPDILGALMTMQDPANGERMPDPQLVNEVMTLIVAGHETTASTLSWVWHLLSQHPSTEEELRLELQNQRAHHDLSLGDLPKFTYTRGVIEEALRLYPAGWLMTRKALQKDYLGEYLVTPGTEIYIPVYLIHRHPALWPDPDRFDPDRFNPERSQGRPRLAMLPFSAGPRNCIGESFARVEMAVHLITAASRLRLRAVDSQPPTLDLGVNLRSKSDFMMVPEILAPQTN
jgi:cytochrome P450